VVFIQNGILLVTKKNEILSFAGKWTELENIILSEVKLRRPKVTCSPSYVDYRPRTNSAKSLDMSHIKGRLCMGGKGQWKENKNLNVADKLTVLEMNIVILNQQRSLWEGD
jgi:hypothetical protein